MKKIREEWSSNREMKRSPHKTKFICGKCDKGCHFGVGLKCDICGHKPGHKKNKR